MNKMLKTIVMLLIIITLSSGLLYYLGNNSNVKAKLLDTYGSLHNDYSLQLENGDTVKSSINFNYDNTMVIPSVKINSINELKELYKLMIYNTTSDEITNINNIYYNNTMYILINLDTGSSNMYICCEVSFIKDSFNNDIVCSIDLFIPDALLNNEISIARLHSYDGKSYNVTVFNKTLYSSLEYAENIYMHKIIVDGYQEYDNQVIEGLYELDSYVYKIDNYIRTYNYSNRVMDVASTLLNDFISIHKIEDVISTTTITYNSGYVIDFVEMSGVYSSIHSAEPMAISKARCKWLNDESYTHGDIGQSIVFGVDLINKNDLSVRSFYLSCDMNTINPTNYNYNLVDGIYYPVEDVFNTCQLFEKTETGYIKVYTFDDIDNYMIDEKSYHTYFHHIDTNEYDDEYYITLYPKMTDGYNYIYPFVNIGEDELAKNILSVIFQVE